MSSNNNNSASDTTNSDKSEVRTSSNASKIEGSDVGYRKIFIGGLSYSTDEGIAVLKNNLITN